MSLIFRSPRRSQPQGAAGANPRWVALGLQALFDLRAGRELISGDRATTDTTGRAPGPGGVGADASGTQVMRFAHRAAFAQTGPITLFFLFDVDALTDYGALMVKQATTTTATPFELRLGGTGPTVSDLCFGRAAAGSYLQYGGPGNLVASGAKAVRLAVTWNTGNLGPSAVNAWVNGVKTALSTISGNFDSANAVTDNAASDVYFFRRSDGATQLDGRGYHAAIFKGVLSDSALAELNANPHDLFAPTQRTLWAPSSVGAGNTVEVPAGSLSMTGHAPVVTATANQSVAAPAGALTLTGNAPTVTASNHQTVSVPAGSLALTGNAPTVTASDHQTVSVPAAALTLTGNAPTVTATANNAIEVPSAALALTGFAPSVSTSAAQTIEVPAGALALTGFAPTVQVGANNSIDVPAGALALAGYAPTATATAHQQIVVPVGTLQLAGFAPTVTNGTGQLIEVPAAAVTMTGYAPTVQVAAVIHGILSARRRSGDGLSRSESAGMKRTSGQAPRRN